MANKQLESKSLGRDVNVYTRKTNNSQNQFLASGAIGFGESCSLKINSIC